MEKFDVVVGLAVVAFVSLVLSGFWSIFGPNTQLCTTLVGYVLLGSLAGTLLLLSRWYKQLETIGIIFTLLYLLTMWITYVSPGYLANC
ncbi:hypothetical protein [Pyrobaculum islandicum]|nr:hypothetical protein [Pyrobaculum islandicum]